MPNALIDMVFNGEDVNFKLIMWAIFRCFGLSTVLMGCGHGSQDIPSDSNRIHLTGCPTQGIEGGCLVIADKTGKTYDISAAPTRDFNKTGQPERPRTGFFAIRLDGTISEGAMSICMQGVVLKDIAWTYTEQKCDEREGGAK
jgi:hypothetical protein